MARFYVSFIFFLTPTLLGWLVLNGHETRQESLSWWRNDNEHDFVYSTIDSLVAYFGPTPVGLGLVALGAVLGPFVYFVVKPRTVFRRRRLGL